MSESNINNRSLILAESFNLSYTVLGDGKKSKIVPLSTGALLATGDSLFGVHDESFSSLKSDDASVCWRCDFCSYVNADGASNTCSICGAERSPIEEVADNFDAQIPDEEKKLHADNSKRKHAISFDLEEKKPSADQNIEDDDFEEKKPHAGNSEVKTTISIDLEESSTADQNIEDSNFEGKEPPDEHVEDENDDDESLNPFSNHSKKRVYS
uniref:Uncharacterized protein n=1 Tax=Asterionellopsis glacialis TaxID=33640 RepID=A0A7S0L052_9STRA|mmetsp:Transcript_1488/g.2077  ORF Transcript_1488/g.2077 Transcript_1488/m.2077 type:complete len:212 (+) Transcript_1488:59-694(+)